MKKLKEKKVTAYIAIYPEDAAFIRAFFPADNFSRSIGAAIDRLREYLGAVAEIEGAVLVYRQTADGEKIWADSMTLPFTFSPVQGWRRVPIVAAKYGYVTQIIDKKETGEVEVWVARRPERCCSFCEKVKRIYGIQ